MTANPDIPKAEQPERVKADAEARPNPEDLAARIREIGRASAALIKRPYQDHGDFLYDELGLPK